MIAINSQFAPSAVAQVQRCWFNALCPQQGYTRYVTIAYITPGGAARCSRTGVWREVGEWEYHEVALTAAETGEVQLGLF